MRRDRPDRDLLSQWLAERCEFDSDYMDFARLLFKSWREFATAAEATAGTPKSFANELRKKGFPIERPWEGLRTKVHVGVRLKRVELTPDIPVFMIPALTPPRLKRSAQRRPSLRLS